MQDLIIQFSFPRGLAIKEAYSSRKSGSEMRF